MEQAEAGKRAAQNRPKNYIRWRRGFEENEEESWGRNEADDHVEALNVSLGGGKALGDSHLTWKRKHIYVSQDLSELLGYFMITPAFRTGFRVRLKTVETLDSFHIG